MFVVTITMSRPGMSSRPSFTHIHSHISKIKLVQQPPVKEQEMAVIREAASITDTHSPKRMPPIFRRAACNIRYSQTLLLLHTCSYEPQWLTIISVSV